LPHQGRGLPYLPVSPNIASGCHTPNAVTRGKNFNKSENGNVGIPSKFPAVHLNASFVICKTSNRQHSAKVFGQSKD